MDSEQVKASSPSLCNILYKSIVIFDNACEMFMLENRWSSVVCPEHKLLYIFILDFVYFLLVKTSSPIPNVKIHV